MMDKQKGKKGAIANFFRRSRNAKGETKTMQPGLRKEITIDAALPHNEGGFGFTERIFEDLTPKSHKQASFDYNAGGGFNSFILPGP